MSRSAMIYLGMDCGGSSCRALAVSDGGDILFRGQAGAANLASTPDQTLKFHLQKAVDGCPSPNQVCACFAGLLTPLDRERAQRLVRQLFPASGIRCEPDYSAALAASPPGTNILIIAGTGSLICSSHNGRLIKSGGRGYLLGDYGSAFRYGRQFLRFHLEQEDLGKHEHILLEVFRATDESTIISKLYREPGMISKLGRMAEEFATDATAGEPYALDFLVEETQRLANLVLTHAERHMPSLQEVHLSLAGGVWRISPIFEVALLSRLKELSAGRHFVAHRIKRAPVEGAVILAKEAAYEHRV